MCLFYFQGLRKKLFAPAKQKDCEELGLWIKSIINHLYWVAVSTPDGDPDIMVAKWRSLLNHICNIHQGHGDLFPECLHENLDGNDRNTAWLDPGMLSVD